MMLEDQAIDKEQLKEAEKELAALNQTGIKKSNMGLDKEDTIAKLHWMKMKRRACELLR